MCAYDQRGATHRISSTQSITEIGTHENTRERDYSEKKLPFCRRLYAAIVDNAGNNGTREDAVRECDLRKKDMRFVKSTTTILGPQNRKGTWL